MLDDLNIIAQKDPQNALDFAFAEPQQLAYDFNLDDFIFESPINNVVHAGMGGSAFPGSFINTFPQIKKPFEVCKNYNLPLYVGQDTLVIISSYSGNTEETISAFNDAKSRGAQIVIMAHGGKLAEIAKSQNYKFIQIPQCPQPRMAAFYFYKAILQLLVVANLAIAEAPQQLSKLAPVLQQTVDGWKKEVKTADNLAKQLALKMVGKTAIIYSGTLMSPAAYKWKISVNENSKNTAWCNNFPEISHNEFIGWSSHPIEKPFACINLISDFEHPRILKRFEITDQLLSGKKPAAINVKAVGDSALEHMLYLILLGDFTTIYLAIINGVNPTPVDLVEKFKQALG